MSLLDKVSLALIPSAYKANKVYSVLPSNGDGDFDFSRPSGAIRVNENGLIETVSSNVPRLNYPLIDGVVSGCPSLLLEPATSNLVTYSEDFSNSIWTAGGSLTVEGGYLAPDGSNNAYKISGSGGAINASLGLIQSTTRSIYARTLSGNGKISLLSYFGNSNNLFDVTEEWQRFEVNSAIPTGVNNFYAVDFRNVSATLSEVIIWGANATNDQSYTTSYIPTQGSIGTRVAETCNNAGNSNIFNDSEGVLYAEISALNDSGTNRIFGISNGGDFNNSVLLRFSSESNIIQGQVRLGGVYQCSLNYDATDATEFNKIAFKYKQNDFSLFANGIERATDTSGNVITGLDVLDFDVSNTNEFYGKVKDLRYFDRALSDIELQALTQV